ncbi:IS3 family transposase [Calidifontibacillus erzurumensis]
MKYDGCVQLFYNNDRYQKILNGHSPVKYRAIAV